LLAGIGRSGTDSEFGKYSTLGFWHISAGNLAGRIVIRRRAGCGLKPEISLYCRPALAGRGLKQTNKQTNNRRQKMRLLIALILPWLTFFTIGRPIAGIICLLLQLTLIGWIPATIWAVYALSQYKTDKKIKKALEQRD
jgi:uncharacterized membrane protein YqaE (UPF0057 family)